MADADAKTLIEGAAAGWALLKGAAEALVALVDWRKRGLAKFDRERVRVFKDELEPLYLEITAIHGDYMDMFKRAVTSLAPAPTVEQPTPAKADVEGVKQLFALQRQDLMGQRSAIRRDAQLLMRSSEELPLESAYLYSIFNYFVRNEPPGADLARMADMARMLARFEPDTLVNTPSSAFFALMANETDPGMLIKMMVAERQDLNAHFSDVAVRYRDLRRKIKEIESKLPKDKAAAKAD